MLVCGASVCFRKGEQRIHDVDWKWRIVNEGAERVNQLIEQGYLGKPEFVLLG